MELKYAPTIVEGIAYWFHDGRVVAVDAATGSVLFETGERALSVDPVPPVTFSDCLAYLVDGGILSLYDLKSGKLRARTQEAYGNPVAIGNRLLLFQRRAAEVYGWSQTALTRTPSS